MNQVYPDVTKLVEYAILQKMVMCNARVAVIQLPHAKQIILANAGLDLQD